MLMHGDFLEINPNVTCSYDSYRNILNSMNITLTNLGHEECEICVAYKQADPLHFPLQEKDVNCSKCFEFLKHKKEPKKLGKSTSFMPKEARMK